MTGRIRPIAGAVCWRDDHILVELGYDSVKDERFYRVIGGGVEFGELAADAVVREFREELDAELRVSRLLGVIESRFTYEGAPGHEIVFLFEGTLHDHPLLTQDECEGMEGEEPYVARWMPLAHFLGHRDPLYPEGVLALLSAPVRA